MRRTNRSALALILLSACIGTPGGVAIAEESPGEVATRFAWALSERNYDEVVNCVYEPWMYAELDSLCAYRPGISHQEREDCAKNFGALSLDDLLEAPKDRLSVMWTLWKWPHLFPPAPPPPPPPPSSPPPNRIWCLTAEMAHKRDDPQWSNLIVRTIDELIREPNEALVVLDVRQRQSFRELNLVFRLQRGTGAAWRVSDLEIRVVAE